MARFEALQDASDAALDEACFDLWLGVGDWLHSRLPAHVAEVDDPREALLRLRDQLAGLKNQLTRQESGLRGASEDIARGIDVQKRKAYGQVQRLNRNLEGISFGSIQGIRVRHNPVDKMEQVLRALREGEAQGLLFQEDLPIEDALDEIFRRYGGGRTGGQCLLDYREHIHLQVEIRRKAGADWEITNPTRLSTGEAIGVGAALMMVVLTEWNAACGSSRNRWSSTPGPWPLSRPYSKHATLGTSRPKASARPIAKPWNASMAPSYTCGMPGAAQRMRLLQLAAAGACHALPSGFRRVWARIDDGVLGACGARPLGPERGDVARDAAPLLRCTPTTGLSMRKQWRGS